MLVVSFPLFFYWYYTLKYKFLIFIRYDFKEPKDGFNKLESIHNVSFFHFQNIL